MTYPSPPLCPLSSLMTANLTMLYSQLFIDTWDIQTVRLGERPGGSERAGGAFFFLAMQPDVSAPPFHP